MADDVVYIPTTYYYRWSTPGQLKEKNFRDGKVVFDEKLAIEQKIEKLKETIKNYRTVCQKCHRDIKAEYVGYGYADKGRSGQKQKREEIDRLMEDARQGKFQLVITPMASRIGRNVRVSQNIRGDLKDLGVQIYSELQPVQLRCQDCYSTLEEQSTVITETISDLQAQLDLNNIRANYNSGMPSRVDAGKPAASLAYGLIKRYQVGNKDSRGSDVLQEIYEWNAERVAVVKRIADEFLNGLGTWKIAQRLNQDGIPSPQNKKWGRSAVIFLLTNPAYVGKTRWGWKPVSRDRKRVIQPPEKWKLVNASYGPIFEEGYWQKIQQEFKNRAKVGGRAVNSDGLLIGLLKCGICGYSMFQSHSKGKKKDGSPKHWRGYVCGTFHRTGECEHNGSSQTVINSLVLNEVSKLFNDETRSTFIKSLQGQQKVDLEKDLKDKRSAILLNEQRLQRAKDAFDDGVDTIDDYREKKLRYEDAIKRLLVDKGKVETKLAEQKAILDWDVAYRETIQRFMNAPTDKDVKVVRRILSRIIERVDYVKREGRLEVKFKLSFD